jgi:hypothetical protein
MAAGRVYLRGEKPGDDPTLEARGERAAQYLSSQIDRMTYFEDNGLVHWLQEAASPSVFLPDNHADIEAGVLQFHQRLKKAIPVMSLVRSPRPGALAETNQAMHLGFVDA